MNPRSLSADLRKTQEEKLLDIFLENYKNFYAQWQREFSCDNCGNSAECWIREDGSIRESSWPKYCLANKLREERIKYCRKDDDSDDPKEICAALVQTLRMWENAIAKSFPTSSTLYNLSNVFGCTVNDFFLEGNAQRLGSSVLRRDGIPRNEREFYAGTFFVYSESPSSGNINTGLLHITQKANRAIAYYRWRAEGFTKENAKQQLKEIEDDPEEYFGHANDYAGEIQYIEGALIITLYAVDINVCDSVHIFIPAMKGYHDSARRTWGRLNPMTGGVGMLSTLDDERSPLSYKICLCEVDKSYSLKPEEKESRLKRIFDPLSQGEPDQYIKITGDEAEDFIDYLTSADSQQSTNRKQ